MPAYTLKFVPDPQLVRRIESMDELDALDAAKEVLGNNMVEVWDGPRFVACVGLASGDDLHSTDGYLTIREKPKVH